jgi:hypothetical protein
MRGVYLHAIYKLHGMLFSQKDSFPSTQSRVYGTNCYLKVHISKLCLDSKFTIFSVVIK